MTALRQLVMLVGAVGAGLSGGHVVLCMAVVLVTVAAMIGIYAKENG